MNIFITVIKILGVLFLIFPTIILCVLTIININIAIKSRKWNKVKGIVSKSELIDNRNCDVLFGYHYKILYHYNLNGKDYSGSLVRAGYFKYFTKGYVCQFLKKYDVGKKIDVYYETNFTPQRLPEGEYTSPESVLETGMNIEVYIFLFILCALLIVEGLIVASIF